jgi:hypothetical protein
VDSATQEGMVEVLAPFPRPWMEHAGRRKADGQRHSSCEGGERATKTHADNSTDHELKEALVRSECSDLNDGTEDHDAGSH